MIKDPNGGLCNCQVFSGGVGSGVFSKRLSIFLESAYFFCGYQSDKEHIFMVEDETASFALKRGQPSEYAQFMHWRRQFHFARNRRSQKFLTNRFCTESSLKIFKLKFSYGHIESSVRKENSTRKVKRILESLEIKGNRWNWNRIYCKIAKTFRVDSDRKADVIEKSLPIMGSSRWR